MNTGARNFLIDFSSFHLLLLMAFLLANNKKINSCTWWTIYLKSIFHEWNSVTNCSSLSQIKRKSTLKTFHKKRSKGSTACRAAGRGLGLTGWLGFHHDRRRRCFFNIILMKKNLFTNSPSCFYLRFFTVDSLKLQCFNLNNQKKSRKNLQLWHLGCKPGLLILAQDDFDGSEIEELLVQAG